ncbi:TPA: bifunctional phosphopantothenoylcysteine decarboxylase/phosphopantothenate--cysteine ligase CoaBC [Candidatus Woesearchaeota archaeon]|nr:bifunctional phosphopantothenoylcysteine decarboxylase/phosphopantothenate--cysteine ligase CoaBC [Candidatus Woesearchaeota archaeon]HIH92253.1 bifunctional phosphopantothenoylcysteine decarboxylase/phosphopantothenate--cysteine ligase CoaBC [Candidatus Woesearchaeota archaeon]
MDRKSLKGKKVVVGVTGGIAAYKVIPIIARMRGLGAEVHVIMTGHACRLADPKDFGKASGHEVATSLFHPSIDYRGYIRKNRPITHVSLADIADLFLVCPATANIIAKIAHGICDDLLTTSICATAAPVLICPAMNVKMWHNPLVQENVKKLAEHGYHFIDPEYGDLACGYRGVGRLAGGEKILERSALLLRKRSDLKGKRVIVTAGATSEPIDPVRVITNRSSGRMGVMLAEQAFLRGAEVVLIRGQNAVECRYPLDEVTVATVKDLHDALVREMKDADIVIHAAAVSDFTANSAGKKIKSGQPLNLELLPTTKILENVRKWDGKVFLVGFKAEYDVSEKELARRAFGLLKDAHADLMVANDVGKEGRGFDVDTNEVLILDKKKRMMKVPLADKRVVADRIIDEVVKRL